MGILENSIGAMFGRGSGDNDGPSFGSAPYAPLATALIGLLAAKAMTGGFGNLGSLFGGHSAPAPSQPTAPQSQEPQGGGGLLAGLGGLLHQFQQNGQGNVAQSWIGSGQNEPVAPTQVTQAIGPDLIRQLAEKTGMSEHQIAQQLSQELPSIIDKLTPQGRLPTHDEALILAEGIQPIAEWIGVRAPSRTRSGSRPLHVALAIALEGSAAKPAPFPLRGSSDPSTSRRNGQFGASWHQESSIRVAW